MQNIRLGKMTGRIFETYKNYVRPHRFHIPKTASIIDMATMCPFPSDQNFLLYFKCVLCSCAKCPSFAIPGQESNKDTTNVCPDILFRV